MHSWNKILLGDQCANAGDQRFSKWIQKEELTFLRTDISDDILDITPHWLLIVFFSSFLFQLTALVTPAKITTLVASQSPAVRLYYFFFKGEDVVNRKTTEVIFGNSIQFIQSS
uniref:SJCHGC02199 protein n=1 Tax=Schistosoma japonicum TaxID=6182 RepID=Q5D8L9_SCHJA|nr:SJCHGC02199 protein [Schistosoma japonicum]